MPVTKMAPSLGRGEARNEPERVLGSSSLIGTGDFRTFAVGATGWGPASAKPKLRWCGAYCSCAWNSVRADPAVTVSASLPASSRECHVEYGAGARRIVGGCWAVTAARSDGPALLAQPHSNSTRLRIGLNLNGRRNPAAYLFIDRHVHPGRNFQRDA